MFAVSPPLTLQDQCWPARPIKVCYLGRATPRRPAPYHQAFRNDLLGTRDDFSPGLIKAAVGTGHRERPLRQVAAAKGRRSYVPIQAHTQYNWRQDIHPPAGCETVRAVRHQRHPLSDTHVDYRQNLGWWEEWCSRPAKRGNAFQMVVVPGECKARDHEIAVVVTVFKRYRDLKACPQSDQERDRSTRWPKPVGVQLRLIDWPGWCVQGTRLRTRRPSSGPCGRRTRPSRQGSSRSGCRRLWRENRLSAGTVPSDWS
jgi:hypothetical protein